MPEVHVPAPVSLPTVEPLHEKFEAEVEPVASVTADPGAAAVTVNVVLGDVYEAVAPTAAYVVSQALIAAAMLEA